MALFNTHLGHTKRYVNYKSGTTLAHRDASQPSFREKQKRKREIEDLMALKGMGLNPEDLEQ